MESMKDITSKRLRDLRIQIGLTQQQLANKVDIELMTYGRYERGVRLPTSDILSRLADTLNCSTDYLLGRVDDILGNTDEVMTLTEDEREFLETYIKAKKSDKETVKDILEIIDKMLDKDEE